MLRRGQHGFVACSLDHGGNLTRVRCHDEPVAHTGLGDTSDNPEDEGFTCQRQEWLAREAAGAQPRRDHAEDRHRGTYKSRAVASSPWRKRLNQCALAPHTTACAMRRKLLSSVLPCSVPIDSGWNWTP